MYIHIYLFTYICIYMYLRVCEQLCCRGFGKVLQTSYKPGNLALRACHGAAGSCEYGPCRSVGWYSSTGSAMLGRKSLGILGLEGFYPFKPTCSRTGTSTAYAEKVAPSISCAGFIDQAPADPANTDKARPASRPHLGSQRPHLHVGSRFSCSRLPGVATCSFGGLGNVGPHSEMVHSWYIRIPDLVTIPKPHGLILDWPGLSLGMLRVVVTAHSWLAVSKRCLAGLACTRHQFEWLAQRATPLHDIRLP